MRPLKPHAQAHDPIDKRMREASRACRILVAVRPQWNGTMRDLLRHPAVSPTFCHTFEEAREVLARERFDMIFCSLRFDHNRLCELLRHVRSAPPLRGLPFIAGLLDWPELDRHARAPIDSIFDSLEFLGASSCLHIGSWLHELGADRARLRLHETILRHAGARSDAADRVRQR
jgi:CheY-like chemotaxis protein